MSEIAKRVELLREQMKAHQVDAYIVPTSDFHETEYVCDYFKARAFMSGFTGSAGTCVFTATEGKLWTDGRYFIQAQNQLEGSGIDLMRMGDDGVATIEEYLLETLPSHAVVGFDGRVLNTAMVENLQDKLKDKAITFQCDMDLVGAIWEDRPALPASRTFELAEKYTGKSAADKLAEVREEMKKAAQAGYPTATDLADYLTKKGLPFREAHDVVGSVVKLASNRGCDLAELTLEELKGFSDLIEEDVYEKALKLEASVAARDHVGATAPNQVKKQVARWTEIFEKRHGEPKAKRLADLLVC